MENFADRLVAAVRERGSPVVVGIDPVLERLPGFIRQPALSAGTAGAAAAALLEFSRRIIAAVADVVPAVKLQSAFFEAWGWWGVEAFWAAADSARAAGLLVIGDVKRGDIGSTAEAYADAYLGRADHSYLDIPAVDAITVNPYLGTDGLLPFVRRAAATGRGLFVLVKTSNHSAGEVQDQTLEAGGTLTSRVAQLVDRLGADLVGESGYSSVGAVVGATYPQDIAACRERMPRAIFLVPGYGAQGGEAAGLASAFRPDGTGAVIAASRSIIYAYGADAAGPAALGQAVRRAALAMAAEIRSELSAGAN